MALRIIPSARDSTPILPFRSPELTQIAPDEWGALMAAAQRGHAGWKTMQTAQILNDAWMCRLEVAATN